MANYDAIIKLVVQGEDALKRIQTRIDKLYKTVSDLETKKKFAGSEAAAKFVRQQATELEKVVATSKGLLKQDESRLVQQSKLNAAVALYERRIKQAVNSGAAELKKFSEQIAQIEEAFDFFKGRKNVAAVQALATELGRMVEYANATNRSERTRAANLSKLRGFAKEITFYEAQGLNVRKAKEKFDALAAVADTNKTNEAKKYTEALARQLKLLKEQNKVNIQIARAAAEETAARRQLEASRSVAAREKLAEAALRRKELAGSQAYAFPIGPNPLSGRRVAPFGEVSAAKAERALIEKEKRQLFELEKRQLVELNNLRSTNIQKEINRYKDLGKAIRGSLSSAAIGGAFPLLFGQSPQAAVGGAIGGLLGGAGGGFAGSLIGTAIGDLVAAQSAVEELGKELGFSSAQAEVLAEAFKQAGRDADALDAAVRNIQGIGLSTNETASAVKLASELAAEYGGRVDKIAQSFANALQSGKVSITTLNSFTAQGIPIQETLAAKYGVSRDKLLQMAKDGQIAVQDLIDELVNIGKAAENTVGKSATAFDKFKSSVEALSVSVGNLATTLLRILGPAIDAIIGKATLAINALNTLLQGGVGLELGKAGTAFTFGATSQGVDNIVTAVKSIASINPQTVKQVNSLLSNLDDASRNLRRISAGDPNAERAVRLQGEILRQRARLIGVQKRLGQGETATTIGPITAPAQLEAAGKGGAKPPEDRTAQLKEDLEAMKLISVTQDGIRDALFEGNRELAIRLAYDQKVYDINRDTAKALLNANYETEKAVYRAQEIVRLKDAQLERDDELRDLARDINEIMANTFKTLQEGTPWGEQEAFKALTDQTIPDTLKSIKEEMQKLTAPAYQIVQAAQAIGQAFAKSFVDAVTGAKSAQEALAKFFESVGKHFIEMATRIMAIQAIQALVMPFLGSGLGRFASSTMTLPKLEGAGALVPGIGGGAPIPSYGGGNVSPLPISPQITPGGIFAEGGFVTGPTRALIGEGGESEYVIPASKMRSAMARYAGGARGAAVIPGNGEGGGGFGGAPAGTIDVRYSIERINNVDYVTADQFQRGMAQAAEQGAIQGERRAMRTLGNSPATRRRIGI